MIGEGERGVGKAESEGVGGEGKGESTQEGLARFEMELLKKRMAITIRCDQ